MRAISDALPGNLRVRADQVRPLLDGLTDQALQHAVPVTEAADTANLPESELLANGQSPYSAPAVALYTTEGQLSAEHALRAALVLRGAPAFSAEYAAAVLARFATSGRTLGVDQATALRGVLTSGAQVEVLSAAAGTGKSFVVAAVAEAWPGGEDRRVFGLAPSQAAAGVLAEEGLTVAANTAAWLAAQDRLHRGSTAAADERWRLRAGDLVIVDEANMASTDHLAAVLARCQAAGAKLLLVGDPSQLGAAGPGGAFADLAERGIRYELADVRRFTNAWERTASLRLREADISVLAEYAKHGRLREGGTAEQAEAAASRAWLADTVAGRESLLIVCDNAAAARVSAALRAELVALGRVQEAGVPLARPGWEGVVAGVGDLVQARRNGWELIGRDGNTAAPINRDTYRVTALRPDGGLTVAPIIARSPEGEVLGDPLALPAAYVAADLTLGYASTAHAAEGRTVDTGHSVVGAATTLPGLLVPMTRGRECNTAWVVTTALAQDADTGQTFEVEPRTPAAVLADILEGHQRERSALAEREQAELAARSTMTHVDQLVDVVSRIVTPGRMAATLDRLTADGALTPDQRAALAADEAYGALERLLRTAELAGHDPDTVLTAAVEMRDLRGARSPAQVLHARISDAYAGRLTPHLTDMSDLIPGHVPTEWAAWLHDRADAADERRHELGAEAARQAPAWAVEALGPVPADDDILARTEWEHRAGWAAAYRELVGYTDDRDPLGNAPAPGLAEKAAMFRAAHEALGLLDVGAEEAEMTEGQLRARFVAYEREHNWAPRNVADELDATHQAADRARENAEIWAARADAPDTDQAEAAQLRTDADAARREAEQLAARAAVLEEADDARARWYVHTAVTRENAHRSGTELRARGIDPHSAADRVTAEEWLQAHLAEQAEAERDREIHDEYELHDPTRELAHVDDRGPAADAAAPDVREISAPDPTERTDPTKRHRVPTIDETAELVARAQASPAEVAAREAADRAREAEENARREELARWSHEADTAADTAADDGDALDRQL
jgi:AAA domain-containing protein